MAREIAGEDKILGVNVMVALKNGVVTEANHTELSRPGILTMKVAIFRNISGVLKLKKKLAEFYCYMQPASGELRAT